MSMTISPLAKKLAVAFLSVSALGTDFDHNIYDFDTGIIYHTTNDENSEGGGIATTYFNDIAIDSVLPQHIENVRQVGCELAENYMERARSGEHGPPPDDVTYFYRNHCL